MTVDLTVPDGTRLRLRAGEWGTPRQASTDQDVVVWTVAVYRQEIGGTVWVRGHTCSWPDPDCAAGWCFEAPVALAAIRQNVEGKR
ncbi:hypothetical protein [Verrucosispora sp. NA02020]|uniref:hypothetical protein n=1 Tax=Verrucosispora sp. NA02020 TaxID=2742132 RepID=UPI0015916472|nr:hypothetical protein [Verrucosispora sp. NA02020]QKW15400.1 hypothetical protein HUT12_23285 [Verrucosispora sp. NA02020]